MIKIHASGIKQAFKHGYGLVEYPTGATYEGHFKTDERCGHGKYTWASGASFAGEFKENLANGWGIYTY